MVFSILDSAFLSLFLGGYVNITNWQHSFFYLLIVTSMCIALVPFVSHVALVHILCFVMGLINAFIFIG